MLIGISGKMGVGKNFISENIIMDILNKLIGNIRIFPISFADQMKVELGIRDKRFNYENLFINKTLETRRGLQEYGTERCRKIYGENIWINSVEMWMKIYQDRLPKTENPIFIISDVRFKNEAKWIEEKKGLLIRINAKIRNEERKKQENINIEHISETDLDNYKFKNIINNDYIEHNKVYNQTEDIIKKYIYRNGEEDK